MNLFRVLDRATPAPSVLRLEGREFKELAVCSVRSVTSLLLVALVLGVTSVIFAKRRWYPVFVAGVVLVAYMPVASCQSVAACELQTVLGTGVTPVVIPLTLLWALTPAGTEASSELRSSRACWDYKTGTLTFSNCCNESDIHWCSRWLCWTKPGCTVCTHDLGCWNNLAAGVSAVPMAGTMEVRRQAMNTFGLIGWGAYLAEAFGLGEVYSVGMVVSYWLVGGSAPHLNITCGIPCSSDAVSWLEVKAPTLSEIYAWVTTIPQALYGLIAAMPIFFGLLLFYMLLRGHVVGALVLLIAVPGAVASGAQCDEDSEDYDEEGDELTQCDECRWKSNDSLCICPFGKVIRKFNDTRYNVSKKCPEFWNVSGTWWICGWGSWWWVAYEVERPYSHPFLPPDPLTAICYITNNSQSVYNVTFKVDWDEKTTHNSSSIFGMQVTTCVLDRRDATCRGCHGACFWTDGKHDRDFGRCGGGTMDGPFTFVQLAIIRLQLNGTRFWWRPSKAVAELLLHKVRHGYGCGITHGVVNCWSCCRGLCDSRNTNPRPPPGKWWPQPGKPADLCIDPAFERQQNNWQPNNWLSQIQYVFDAMVGKVGCPVYTEPAYPVCPGHAWYPDDGGKVILIGSRQYVGALPETLRSFVGLMAVLLIFMVASGARIVPVLVMIAAGLHLSTAECYPSCPSDTYCNSFFCVSTSPCVAEVEGALVWPEGWPFMVSESAGISHEVIAALTPAATLATLAQGAGLPGLGALVVTAAAFKPQPVFTRHDFYCGNNTAVDEVIGYDPYFLLYSIPLVFSTSFLFSLGCFMGILAGIELRARIPWRLIMLVLSSSTTTLLELVVVGGVVIQFVDFLMGRVAVQAAYHRALLAGPAASAAWHLPTWPEALLGVLCVALYMTVVGRAGLAALVAWKLSRGLIGATILLVAFGRGPDRGVLGAELCVPLLDSPIPEASFTWWYVSGMLSFFAISFAFYSHGGKRIKLRLYARWCWLYCRIRLAVAVSPVGRHGWHARLTMYAWTVCSFIWPRACSAVALGLVGLGAAVDLVDWFLETVLCIRPRCTSIATTADLAARACNNAELSALLQRWWYKGWLMYDHMGQVSSDLRERVLEMGGTCEPVSVFPEELQRVKDDTMTLTCGSWFGGKPVVARCGQYVLIGSARSVQSLPPGYTLTAPLLVTRPKKSFFKILKASMLGKCPLPGSGQVVTIDTATGASMGLATSGVLFTTFHATSGRSLAGPTGSRNPYWSSPSDDVVCYPLIEGMSCLDPCSCGDHSRWVIRSDGQLLHGIQNSEQHVVLDCPTPIDQLKGSSGSPILCDKGHVTGMMVGAMVNSGIASRVRFVKPWSAQPGTQNTKNNIPAYPTVPASGYKMVGYIAPTGSGKSTKLPMSLAAHGHRVLVLNPSVITTKAMYKYMKTLMGRSPNVYAGTQKNAMAINNGSKITYMTYGRFLVDPDTWLRKNDVVLCDECHATDPTTVLGIGCALVGAEQCGVKLTILATATPPGTAWTPHSSITEVALDSSGTIPFYGLTLNIEQYRTGRHVIFCHSKAECTRVATELLKGGVAAVTAWRGHLEAISEAKDLVVVATDALSTGYTGNFDTVTDCCSVVEEDIDVDLNPTFTLSVCVKPADAALRMQRRGRTGRGKPGTYRYVVKGAPPSGVTSTAASWAAAETGYVWHGLQTVTICEYLEAYQENPYTCRIPNDPCEGARCLAILKPFFRELEVTKPAVEGLSWPLLYGAQRLVCMRAGSQAPSDDIRWRGLDGEAAVPLLFRLGNVDCEITSHDFARRMAAELGDTSYRDTGIGPILLAGAAIAAAVAIVGATGSLVISSVWEVRTGGSPVQIGADNLGDRGKVQEGGPVPVDALREVATSLDYPFLTTVWGAIKDGASLVAGTATNTACAVKGYFSAAPIVEAIPVGSAGVAILDVLHLNLLAIASGGLAVIGAKSAPALATLAALFAGAQAFAPPQIMWLVTIAGGIITSMVANPKAGCMVAAGFLAGSKLGSFGCFELLFNALAGYEACVTACALTLELLDGSADAMSWVSALPGLINPGAAVAGIVLALILRTASGSDMTPWLNRLLAAIPRSNALPDGFFAAPPEMTKLSQAVRCFSLSARLKAWCDAAKEPDYIYCSAGWIGRMARFVAGIINYIKAFIVERFPTPKVPMLSCSKGYSGKWRGTGSVTTTCACGKVLTMTADMLDDVYSSRWSGCKNALLRRIPINTTTTISGALTPDLEEDNDFTFLIGAAHLVRLVRRGQQWWLVASTLGKLTSEAVYAASEYGPVRVRDEPISTFCGDVTGGFFTEGQSIMFNCRMKRLPICLGGRQIRQPGLPYRPRLFEGAPAETVNIQCHATKEARETAKQAVEMLDTTVQVAAKMLDAKEEKVQTMKKSCERMLAECMPPPKMFTSLSKDGKGYEEPSEGMPKLVKDFLKGPTDAPEMDAGRIGKKGVDYVMAAIRRRDELRAKVAADFAAQHAAACEVKTLDAGLATVEPTERGPVRPVQCEAEKGSFLLVDEGGDLDEAEPETLPVDITKVTPERKGEDLAFKEGLKEAALVEAKTVLEELEIEKSDLPSPELEPLPLSSEEVLDGTGTPEALKAAAEEATSILGVAYKAAAIGAGAAKAAGAALASGATKATKTTAGAVTSTATKAASLIKRGAKGAGRVLASARKEDPVEVFDLTTLRNVTVSWSCGSGGSDAVRTSDFDRIGDLPSLTRLPKDHKHTFKDVNTGLSLADRTRLSTLPDHGIELQAVCEDSDTKPKGDVVVRTLRHRCCGEDRSLTKSFGSRTPCVLLGPLWGDAKGGIWKDGDRILCDEDEIGSTGKVLDLVHESEEKCGLSYIWSGAPIAVQEPKRPPVTRPLTAQLRARADQVYVTQPQDIYRRLQKVTIEQVEAQVDEEFRDAYNLAKAKASRILSPQWTYEEAVAKVRARSARGHVANITVADLQTSRGKRIVEEARDGILTGTLEAPFMLRPKSEVFPNTKGSRKPPRLICYPSLEFRVAEKMILGDPSLVAKAVMGPSYGFQYPPHQRARVLSDMWKSKKSPICYTLDGVCFDSTITEADIEREGEIFAAASSDPAAVRALHKYYAKGPMVGADGLVVGVRHCRASGTLTTSSGNSITCYIKVSAACRKAKIPNPSFLIHGDDVVVIAEKDEEDHCEALGRALASYGYACTPEVHADLSTAESCSATLDSVRTVRGIRPVLSTDMRRGLGRVLAEYGDPVGTAWGYTISYPTHPIVCYILLPVLLQTALNNGDGPNQDITIDVRGNTLRLPLSSLGSALRSLHGPDILCVTGRSATVMQQTAQCLQFFGMRGIGYWRRIRAKVKVRLRKAGPAWAALAHELLWNPGDSDGPLVEPGTVQIPTELWEHSWEGLELTISPRKLFTRSFKIVALLALLAIGVSFFIPVSVLT